MSTQELQACITATNELTNLIGRNKIATENNAARTQRYRADHITWQKKKQAHDDKVNRWKNRSGEFEKFKNYGISQDFKIEWGGASGNATEDCRACAKRSLEGGWWNRDGKMAKNIGWAGQDQVCELSPGNSLLGWEGYVDDGSRWGWNVGGSRKWWTCMKSQNQKDKELGEYNNANPGNLTEPEPKDKEGSYAYEPVEPTPTAAINCCSNLVNVNLTGRSMAELSNINQSCQQSIQQRLNEASTTQPPTTPAPITSTTNATLTAAPITSTTNATLTAAPPQLPATLADEEVYEDEEVEEEVAEEKKPNKNILLAGGGLFSSMSISCFIIILFIFMFQK